jgi:hypothetical protein
MLEGASRGLFFIGLLGLYSFLLKRRVYEAIRLSTHISLEVNYSMACLNPKPALLQEELTGKKNVIFLPKRSDPHVARENYERSSYLATPVEFVNLPCGKCDACRFAHAKMWAIRCMHEAQLHEHNCFITLTYDDEHLPENCSLVKKDFQDFMKRLKSKVRDSYPRLLVSTLGYDQEFADLMAKKLSRGIRFYMCGEYGDKLGRPHYHALLFGFDFPDKKAFKVTGSGELIYVSEFLQSVWKKGYSSIGRLTFSSAAYVARYCMKKVTGKNAYEHYQGRQPEYTCMSRRPGIAKEWISKYHRDVYPQDRVVDPKGYKSRPPRFYDSHYECLDPDSFAALKQRRRDKAIEMSSKEGPSLESQRKVWKAKLSKFVRSLL